MSTDLEKYYKTDDQKAGEDLADAISKKVRDLLDNESGKEVLDFIKNYFDFHINSSKLANHDHARTNYLDGQKSVLCFIDGIIDGTIK